MSKGKDRGKKRGDDFEIVIVPREVSPEEEEQALSNLARTVLKFLREDRGTDADASKEPAGAREKDRSK